MSKSSVAPPAESSAQPTASRGSLLVIFLTVFVDLLGFAMVLPLLPIYGKEFLGESAVGAGLKIGLLMSVFSLMQFFFAPLWGRLSDRIGRRPVLIVGLAGSTVFYFLFGLATVWKSLFWLFITRIGAGIAGATISTAQAYIADCTTKDSRAKGMALIGAAFGLAFTLGPLLGAAAFLSTWAAGTSQTSAEVARQLAASPWPGYAASGLSAVALLLAIFMLPESLKPDSQAAARKILDLGALRSALSIPTIPAILLTSFLSLMSFGGFEATLSLLLKEQFKFEFHHVLLFFTYIGVVLSIVQGGLVRRLSGKVPEMTLALAGSLISMLGFILLMLAARPGVGLTWILLAAGVEVAGFSFVTPSLASLISRRSDPARQGGVLGISQSVSAMARICGPLAFMPIFDASPNATYLTAIVLMLVASLCLAFGARGGHDYGGANPGSAH